MIIPSAQKVHRSNVGCGMRIWALRNRYGRWYAAEVTGVARDRVQIKFEDDGTNWLKPYDEVAFRFEKNHNQDKPPQYRRPWRSDMDAEQRFIHDLDRKSAEEYYLPRRL